MNNLKHYFKGWLVGDFNPCLFSSKDVEVGLKFYVAGEEEPNHVHRIVTEYTIVIEGIVEMKGQQFQEGDIVTMLPGESTSFKSITNSKILVIKTPSIPSDKEVL
jgi:quercetin dioxygenase-like cupin family protein